MQEAIESLTKIVMQILGYLQMVRWVLAGGKNDPFFGGGQGGPFVLKRLAVSKKTHVFTSDFFGEMFSNVT